MNVPNTLTVLRVIMIPFFVLFMLGDITSVDKYIALGIFIAASLTDTLDGYLARRTIRSQISENLWIRSQINCWYVLQ